jgi:FkbM family methyltransferase
MKNILKYSFKKIFDSYIDDRIYKYLLLNHKRLFKYEFASNIWDQAIVEHKDKLIKNLANDVKLYCYTDSVLAKLIFTEDFEENEQIFLTRYLSKGDIYIDIGANIGIFVVIAARLVGEEGKVIAFEPTPLTFKRLQENCQLNDYKNIDLYQIALSDEVDKLLFYISNIGFDAWNSFALDPADIEKTKILIDTYPLRNILECNKDIYLANLIKIDVEGWEHKVLSGGKDFFSNPKAPTLLIEFTDQNALHAGSSCKELYKFLVSLGYSMYKFDLKSNRILPEKMQTNYPYSNLIATKDLDSVNKRLSESGKH